MYIFDLCTVSLHTPHNLPPMILNPRDPDDVLWRVTLRLLVSSPWVREIGQEERNTNDIFQMLQQTATAGFNTASLTLLTISPLRSRALSISYLMKRQSHTRFRGLSYIKQWRQITPSETPGKITVKVL